MRRKQTDLNFKKAGAPSRLQVPPPSTRAPILEELGRDGTTERVQDLQGRTDIVHKHFKELFTEWMWQRWPYEVFPPDCHAPDDVLIHTRYGPQYSHVPGRQAHEVVFILRRMVEQANERRIPIFVMDCDVAAAFDHVSHHLIIDALEALKVPSVLVSSWIRETQGV